MQDTAAVLGKMLNITEDQASASLAELTMLKESPRTTDTSTAAAFPRLRPGPHDDGNGAEPSAGAVTD
jgi:hypothetical protein